MAFSRTLRVLAATAIVSAVAMGAGVLAANATGTSATVYYACLQGGALSKVGTTAPTCASPSTQISWNKAGPAGPAGNTVLSGAGAPSSTIGVAGNFYLDYSSYTIYGPASHTCLPLPCHTVWGTGTPLVGPQGPPGQGVAYDTQSSDPIPDPNGQSERVLTQTITSGGDFSVEAKVEGVQFGTSNAQSAWNCDLVAANPGGPTVTIDSSDQSSDQYASLVYLQGVVSLAPGGFIGINCDEGFQNPGDDFTFAHITSTQVSGFSIVPPS